VLVDDIISSGRTMIETARQVIAHGGPTPVCIAVHGLFADASDAALLQAGARVITTNSVPHKTNGIDVASILADAIADLDRGIFRSSLS
jgi:ribose-phosphate pyrophosphokinase